MASNDSTVSMGNAIRGSFLTSEDYHIPADAGDYIGSDGYLYCGKCRTRKEFRRFMEPLNGWMIVPCMCKCQQAERDAQRAQEQHRKEQALVRSLFKYSLVDERFHTATFANFRETPENSRALTVCKNYVRYFDKMCESSTGLLMYGSPGTGKTFAAACIANELMQRGVPVMVTSIVKLTSGSNFSDGLQEILAKMKSAHLLVLDDLGTERNTDFKAEQIFDVINSRYASKRPMIITTNVSLDAMKTESDLRYSRIYDRILEVCHPVRMEWESFRVKAVRASYSSTKALLESRCERQ